VGCCEYGDETWGSMRLEKGSASWELRRQYGGNVTPAVTCRTGEQMSPISLFSVTCETPCGLGDGVKCQLDSSHCV
jgi:hypothetical protein